MTNTDLYLMDFSINKIFTTRPVEVGYSLDLHFNGDVHLTNWGRFISYDEAHAFGLDLLSDAIPDYHFKQPHEILKEDPQCSVE